MKHKKLFGTILAAITLMLLLTATDPTRLPAVFLIIPFGLLFIVLSAIIAGFLRLQGLRGQRWSRTSLVLAGLLILLLILQSLGQLTLRDGLTLVTLFLVAYFYLGRLTHRTSE